MNTKKILSIIALIIVIVVLIVFFFNYKNNYSPVIIQDNLATSTVEKTSSSTQTEANSKALTPTISQPNSAKDIAWVVFQKYLGYNKSHNLDGVKSIVYKVSPVCADKVATAECKNRMDLAYQYGSSLKKEDFINVWSDQKQTILATDFKIQEDDNVIGRNRAIIFFINDTTGLKLLSFSPFKGAVLPKASTTREELLSKLTTYTEDKDQDGIADYDEQCLSVSQTQTCVKTDPKLRDTNGNGWWDGVEALMK